MLRNTRVSATWISFLALAVLASPSFAWKSEHELLAIVQDSNASFSDRTTACRELAVVGTEASVPVLAKLLGDEKLSHLARYGLEPIPSPKVDEALVEALGTQRGKHLIGVINSIANRGEAEAIGPVSQKLDDADPEVAQAAANCLGRLGTPRAAEILQQEMSIAFAPACLVCGRILVEQNHTSQAVELLSRLSTLDGVPQHVRLAAMINLVGLQGAAGLDLLATALGSNDEALFDAGLRAARLINAREATPVALGALKDASPGRAALLLSLLGELAQRESLSAVLEAAGSNHTEVRVAALESLATLGGADHVPLLLEAAGDKTVQVAEQAQQTLVALKGEAVDQAVLSALQDDFHRPMAIRMVGKRRITAGLPALLELLDSPLQLEVVAALGETVSLTELDVLGKLVLESSQGKVSIPLREAVARALHAACQRMPNRDATVIKLAGYLNGAPEEAVRLLMDELRQVGGEQALATVAAAARGDDEMLKEYATQALGQWLDKSAEHVLLELARSERHAKYGIRSLRGYIRLSRQFSMSQEKRSAMCRTALQIAERQQEKELILEVLERYPSVEMLQIAIRMADDPGLKEQAIGTARQVAGKLDQNSGEVRTLLDQIDVE